MNGPHFFHPTLREELENIFFDILTNSMKQHLYSEAGWGGIAFTVLYEHLGFLCPSSERQHELCMQILPVYSEDTVESHDLWPRLLSLFGLWLEGNGPQ